MWYISKHMTHSLRLVLTLQPSKYHSGIFHYTFVLKFKSKDNKSSLYPVYENPPPSYLSRSG